MIYDHDDTPEVDGADESRRAEAERLFHIQSLYRGLFAMKHGKAVPSWSRPKEVWEMILKKALEYYECRTEEAEFEAADEVVALLQDTYVLQDGPFLWH